MLFRKEALEHRQTQWTGKVLLLKGWPVWITLLATFGFITVLLFFLLYTSYTRRITVSGEIITQPHTINLFSPQQGVISRLLVKTGQTVTAGTPLYQIDVSRVSRSGNVSVTTLSALKKQQQQIVAIIEQLESNKRQTLENLQQQLRQYLSVHETSQTMTSSALEGLNAMRRSMEAYDSYRRKGLINTDQQNNQRYLFYQQQSVYQSLNAQTIQESLQITSLRSELVTKAVEFDTQIARYRYQQGDLERQLAEADAHGMLLITAPSAGKISSLSVTTGQMVNTGDSLAQLIPADRASFYLIAWLPNDSVPFVSPGKTINIRYAAFPFEKYGQFPGKIISVSSAPAPAQEMAGYASAPRTTTGAVSGAWYKAIVALNRNTLAWHGQPLVLASGMQAQSTVFLEKRPLYQWILSPYYNMKKSVTGPVNE